MKMDCKTKRHGKNSKLPTIEQEPEDEISDISSPEQTTRLDKFTNTLLYIIRQIL